MPMSRPSDSFGPRLAALDRDRLEAPVRRLVSRQRDAQAIAELISQLIGG